jgi:hypothetical protein
MGREIVIGLHSYQPPREAIHPSLSNISTDPQKVNWTSVIEKQCYTPLAKEGILEKVSFDIYQTLLVQLEKLNPDTAAIYKKAMIENGIGDAFIHPILPDYSRLDKSIVISAGAKRFKEITGHNPKIFWPPETAIDTETLEVIAENNYEGFVCAPEQIKQQDGSSSDNKPTLIDLPSGKQIIAYPFDRPISSKLAFDLKHNADTFTNYFIKPKKEHIPDNQILIAWTDAETFGHHFDAVNFLKYLLDSSLPSIGLYPVSINNLKLNINTLPIGKIIERSAWSCPHGNLIRWSGSCDCNYGQDTSWKQSFYGAMKYLNEAITSIVQRELGNHYPELISNHYYEHYTQQEVHDDQYKSLSLSKISSLVARTSCATFFSTPEVSGKINLIYAYQSLLYLKESGLVEETANLNNSFMSKLSEIHFPNSHQTALSALEEMLNG